MRQRPRLLRCLAAAASCIAIDAREPLPDFAAFISGAQEYCYDALVRDPSCCLDATIAPGVRKQELKRPGTTWSCDSGCHDAWFGGAGPRGGDVLWTPKGADCDSPRVLFLHGGSWEYGSPRTNGYPSLVSKLAALTGAVMLAIDYPLSPVGNFSSIMDASHNALQWLYTHGPDGRECSNSRGSAPLLVAGDSAGGGSAVSVLLLAREMPERWPQLAGGFVYSPWTNLKCDTPTYYYNAFGTATSRDGKVAYSGDIVFQAPPRENAREYLQSALDYVGRVHTMLSDPVASPFYREPADFEGLPPILVTVSNTESIAGDSIVLANKAAQGGVQVHMDVYPGMWHDFPMYSEGCGSNQPLWQGSLALNRTGEFVDEVARVWRKAQDMLGPQQLGLMYWPQCATRSPHTWIHYGVAGDRTEPWIPLEPIELLCHEAAARFNDDPPITLDGSQALAATSVPAGASRDVVFFLSGFASCALLGLATAAIWQRLRVQGSCSGPRRRDAAGAVRSFRSGTTELVQGGDERKRRGTSTEA